MHPKTPDEFREHADESERLAERASNPNTREIMIYLAQRWRNLAEQDEIETLFSKPKSRTLSPSS